MKKNSISLVIIAKNEELGLEKAISSCRNFVDEVIISVDSASTDETLEVAKKFADKVVIHDWKGSFADARNKVQKYVKTEWVLHLDGHEYVEDCANIKEKLDTEADAIFIKIIMESGFTFYYPRIVRQKIKWQHAVHNTPKSKKNIKYDDFVIKHDRINLQSEKGAKIRHAQREEMLKKELEPDIEKDKNNVRANFYLGNLYLDKKEWKKAIPYYKKVAKKGEKENQKWLARFHLGICYNELKKPLWALWHFWKAEKEQPNRWETAKMLGTTYAFIGWDKKAIEHWIDSFKVNTGKFMFCPLLRNDAETWDWVSLAFATLGDLEKSKIACRQALREEKDNGPGLLSLEKLKILEEVVGINSTEILQDANIEVCFLVYQRPERVPQILEQLKAQSIQNFRVNIWNNSGKKLDISNFPKSIAQIIDSKKNIGSQARFKLAKETKGNPIIFFDDDQSLNPNFVEYNFRQYLKFGPKCILGWFTRIFDKESYWKSTSAIYGQEVDYIATKAMVFDREILDKEPLLQEIPKEFEKVEDLYLCYLARMKHDMKMIKIDRYTWEKPDGKDQWSKVDKEKAFQLLRTKKWWLLADGVKIFGGFRFKIRKGVWDEQILTGEINPSYYQMPQNPKVVVDIGAHIGGTAVLAASLGAKVYAYEPTQDNFNLLLENIKLNNLEHKIHCVKKGVGNPGKRMIYFSNKNSGMGTFTKISERSEEVEIIGIKEVFKNIKHCDLLKIDCEGAEYEFLEDLPYQKIDNISLELHSGPQQKIVDHLRKFYNVRTTPAIDGTSLMVFCTKKDSVNPVLDYISNLNLVKNTLDKLAIPCFLINGTLLEAVRKTGQIEHNNVDADLGINEEYQGRTEEIVKELEKLGFTENKRNHYTYKNKVRALQFVKNGHHTDLLFIYRQKNDAYFVGAWRPTRPKGNKKYTAYVYSKDCFVNFEKAEFRGTEFDIPGQAEKFLEERYGKHWKIPQTNWNYLDQKDNPSLQPNYEIL